jgi:hypothetical protein
VCFSLLLHQIWANWFLVWVLFAARALGEIVHAEIIAIVFILPLSLLLFDLLTKATFFLLISFWRCQFYFLGFVLDPRWHCPRFELIFPLPHFAQPTCQICFPLRNFRPRDRCLLTAQFLLFTTRSEAGGCHGFTVSSSLQLPSRTSVSLSAPTPFWFSLISFATHASEVRLVLLTARHFPVRLSVPGSWPVDWARCVLLSPILFQSILSTAKLICSLLILFWAPKRSVQWLAVSDFGLICFPLVVVPALWVLLRLVCTPVLSEPSD